MLKVFVKDQSGSLKFIVLLIILSMASVYAGFQAGNAFFARRTGDGEEPQVEEQIVTDEDLPEESEEEYIPEDDMLVEDHDEVEEEAEEEIISEEPAQEETESPDEASSEMDIDREAEYLVQAGAFGREENAESLVIELREQNFPAFISSEEPFRVQVVGGDSRAEAEDVAEQLMEAGYEGFVHSQ